MKWSVIINYQDGTWSCDDVVCRGGKRDFHSLYNVALGKEHLGMVQSVGTDGWMAVPASHHYDESGKIVGPHSVEGFINRRAAITYLLQAEGYRAHHSEKPSLRKGTGRYLNGGTVRNPNFKE